MGGIFKVLRRVGYCAAALTRWDWMLLVLMWAALLGVAVIGRR